jgi:chromosome partitioning protein
MAVTAVVNQKGGVGKTTVTLGLAAAGAARGRRVLVVDVDPQANATTGLGVWSAPVTVDAVLEHDVAGAARRAITTSSWELRGTGSVDVLPSSPNLAQREHQMAMDVIGAQDRLAVALSGVAEDYDEVVIDCPPSLGLLTVNALFAADRVLVVAEPAAWSSDGVDQILRNIGRISERRGGRPEVAGIVVNRLGRTRDAAFWAAQLAEVHPSLVLDPPIRLRAAIAEAAAGSLPITALTRPGSEEAVAELLALFDALDRPPAMSLAGPPAYDLPSTVHT